MHSNVRMALCTVSLILIFVASGCAYQAQEASQSSDSGLLDIPNDAEQAESFIENKPIVDSQESQKKARVNDLAIVEDYRDSFSHGPKTAEYQKYIVLHDTEGESSPQSVIDYWDSNGNLVAAHFIVGKDGEIYQCVPLDEIAHHAGYGDTGHNELFGVEDESRDDMRGTKSIGSQASDYGMNSHSVGIEMVHVGGSGDYPEAQLEAVDALIEYIDDYYGFESEIIDHKAWRTGNSDTSVEFLPYFENYKTKRTHE